MESNNKSNIESNKIEPVDNIIKVRGKKPSVGNWKKVTLEGKEPYWTLVVDNKEDRKASPYGDVDPEKMGKDWDKATSEKGRPPLGGAKDD